MINTSIINNSKQMQNTIKSIYENNNVFFILLYALIFLYLMFATIIHRICQLPRLVSNIFRKKKITYARKVSNNKFIEKHTLMLEEPLYKTFSLFMFFFLLGTGKLIMHIAKIIWWICIHIISPVFKWAVILFGIMSLSGAIADRNRH